MEVPIGKLQTLIHTYIPNKSNKHKSLSILRLIPFILRDNVYEVGQEKLNCAVNLMSFFFTY